MTWLTQGPSEVPKTTLRFLDPRLRKAALLAATVHHSEGPHIDTARNAPRAQPFRPGSAASHGGSAQSTQPWHATTRVKSLQPGARPSLSVQGLHRGQTQRHAASPATPVAHWGREPKPPAHRAAVCHSSSGRHALTVMAQSLRHIKMLLAGRTVQDTHGPSQESPAAGPKDFGMCRVWAKPFPHDACQRTS